jgi:hypothetical protein
MILNRAKSLVAPLTPPKILNNQYAKVKWKWIVQGFFHVGKEKTKKIKIRK